MNLKRLFISIVFLVMIVAWIASAIVTVLPDSASSKVCYLGYYAHCSFTPFGTIISIVGAVSTLFVSLKINLIKF